MTIKFKNIVTKKLMPKKGMKVKLLDKLEYRKIYPPVTCSNKNIEFQGKIVQITETHYSYPKIFKIKNTNDWFHMDMIDKQNSNGVVH